MWDWFFVVSDRSSIKIANVQENQYQNTSFVMTCKNYFWSTWRVSCSLKLFSRKVKPAGEAVLMHLGLTCSSTPLIIAGRSALARPVMHFYLPARRERMEYFRTIMPADPSGAYLWLKKGKSHVKLGVGGM